MIASEKWGDDGESPELPAENNLHGWSVEAGMLEQNKHLQSIFHGALAEHLHSIILKTNELSLISQLRKVSLGEVKLTA